MAQSSSLPPDTLINQVWDGSNWVPSTRTIFEYSEAFKPIAETDYLYFPPNWLLDERTVYTYDIQGFALQESRQLFSGEAWSDIWRQVFENDEHGNRLSSLYQEFDDNAWVSLERILFDHSAQDSLLEEVYQVKVGNDWFNDFRNFYHRNPQGRLDSLAIEGWDWDDEVWFNETMVRHTYNDQGLLSFLHTQTWELNEWTNDERESFAYRENGALFESILEDWTGSIWVNLYRTVVVYGADDWVDQRTYQEWDYDDGLWVGKSRDNLIHDDSGNLLTVTYQTKNTVTGEWQNQTRQDRYYMSPSAINEEKPLSARLLANYPNPFNPSTTIRFQVETAQNISLVVYDALGREVHRLVEDDFPAGYHTLQWHGRDGNDQLLESGVYLLHLRAGEKSTTRKLLLLR